MARCEDFPCCGHEAGCCPDYLNGRQMNMVCTCGKKLPINNRSSICASCLVDSENVTEEELEAADHLYDAVERDNRRDAEPFGDLEHDEEAWYDYVSRTQEDFDAD